jgi:hypothetical protein
MTTVSAWIGDGKGGKQVSHYSRTCVKPEEDLHVEGLS